MVVLDIRNIFNLVKWGCISHAKQINSAPGYLASLIDSNLWEGHIDTRRRLKEHILTGGVFKYSLFGLSFRIACIMESRAFLCRRRQRWLLVFGKGGRLKEQISRAGIFVFKRPPIWTTLLEHYVRWTMLVLKTN